MGQRLPATPTAAEARELAAATAAHLGHTSAHATEAAQIRHSATGQTAHHLGHHLFGVGWYWSIRWYARTCGAYRCIAHQAIQ